MGKRLNITVLVDTSTIPTDDPDFKAKQPEPSTESFVINTLRSLKHNVLIQGAVDDIGIIVNALKANKPDLVFNLTEEFGGDRRLDKNITALLEMTGVPFTGTGTMGLMLCRDKRLCKQLLSPHKIRVPGFVSLPQNSTVSVPKTLRYPLVVKPALEDGSEGISNASIIENETALKERAMFVHKHWNQPAIAEEYIEGRELYVSILGNKRLTVLPVRECFFHSDENSGPHLATYRVKWNKEYRKKRNIEFGFAKLDNTILSNIKRICKRVYHILQIRDYGRIDLRLTPDNRLVVLEANPNPDIAFGEDVAESAGKGGIPYEKLIERIIHSTLERYE